MPRKYAAKSKFTKKAKAKTGKRRLMVLAGTSRPTARPTVELRDQKRFKKGNLRGRNPYNNPATRGRVGAAAVDSSSGAKRGFVIGKRKTMAKLMNNRKLAILKTITDSQFPVIKVHNLEAVGQIDWPSGSQSVNQYDCGYTTIDLQNMLTQANSAQTVSTAAILVPTVNTLTNQRMDYYDRISKFNFKNTCSHTVYMEVRAYEAVSYHSFNLIAAWQQAMNNDNMLQDAANYGAEEVQTNIGKRPDFKLAELNVRWRPRAESTFKITLEPGQETSYTYIQRGSRFDMQKFNVQQGSSAFTGDVYYGPPFASQILVFARSEMIADALDTDVTYGSGHIAVNKEVNFSYAAVPYVKPLQTSSTYAWGTVIEANELDLNQYQANNDPYEEQM